MRCKKHLADLTSTIGVCSSCLRERLQPLLAAQAKSEHSVNSDTADNHRRRKPKPKPEENPNPPPPLNFPRSASPPPYADCRKSDFDRGREKLFFGTPQVSAAACDDGVASEKRRHGGRFWMLSNFFRARLNKTEPSHKLREDPSPPTSTTSWFSTILPQRHARHPDRGLSPSIAAENGKFSADELDTAQERSESGNSSESSPAKQKAMAQRRSRMGPTGKGLTGLAFCLSPLVRASPNRHWNHKGMSQELGGAGGPHHISSAASFCANRSRKLADFGRGAHNR